MTKRTLSDEEIAALSSVYIDAGVKQDAWKIERLELDSDRVTATVSMTSLFVSPTDPEGFHLTVFSTLEFLAQLANIYLHVEAGHEAKTHETWMREATITSKAAIRDPTNITVEMDVVNRRRVDQTLIAIVDCRVFDGRGGLFTARLRGLLR